MMKRREAVSSLSASSEPLALAAAVKANPRLSPELQQLWFTLLREPWSTLVVMPSHPGGSSIELTRALAEVARMHRGSPPMVIDARGAELGRAPHFIIDMSTHVDNGGMVLVAADAVVENQVGIPLALAANAVLLTVTLGQADVASAERTLELLGRQRILGCVTVPAVEAR
ncbi:hypothetical protein FGE12_09325 [Aggregicoccus sp. 17bor-14]|uniref:hypothetical protein n=1 Tax=Myxococcaceae TaxID=31 RepID=UPI00129C3C4D|nr:MULTISPECIES: hypothetical protein [Myxococcaceae]MBF5042600.1 hypothetical protein [Simulacricoccus sp. 17bor-14]MRI88368.1 hypothetical protein [Aggregicoccus sp. 17bor-14]